MDRADRIRLRHMLDSAREALAFAEGRQRDDLDTDRQLALAVVKCLEIVGEAANNISPETRDGIRTIPWSGIINMRHRLIHGYFTINLDIVWQTLADDLPPLVGELRRILETREGT